MLKKTVFTFHIPRGEVSMRILIHVDCGQPAIETPSAILPQAPESYPFNCLSCLEEVEDVSELRADLWISQ